MSLQWTLVAAFLYSEIAVIVLLLLPFISVSLWRRIFKSRFLKSLAVYANFYFLVFFVILLLLFLDSIRQMNKYSVARTHESDHGHLDAELQQSMKVFRAQRNCYIAGFALFLAPVIRRLASLISEQATLKASLEATVKQAKSATDVANRLMKEKEKWEQDSGAAKDNEGNAERIEYEEKLRRLKDKLEDTENELSATKNDLEVVKRQAEGTSREYDRLLAEHDKLQKLVESASGDTKSKKDE